MNPAVKFDQEVGCGCVITCTARLDGEVTVINILSVDHTNCTGEPATPKN